MSDDINTPAHDGTADACEHEMTHAFGLSPHLPEMASPAPSIVFARPADIMRANSAAPVGSTKPNGVRPGLSTITMDSLQRKDFPPREMVLTPLLPAQGLMMIYGPRGKGKTWLSLSIAHAIASGGEVFEGWHAPKPRRILVVDGEMQGVAIRDRLAAIAKGANAQPPDPENFQILAMDMQGRDAVAPNIAIREGQLALAPFIEHADVVIFDNLSTLAFVADENDAAAWGPVQEYLLRLRRDGKAVILVHHSGKGGQQRGTSRREDALDTVLALRTPPDFDQTMGACFDLTPEKGRGVDPAYLAPFRLQLEVRDGAARWQRLEMEDAKSDEVAALAAGGMSIRKIAAELGMSRSAVHRALNGGKA